MFIIRAPKDPLHPFTQVSNSLVNDNRLSLKSKGLLFFLLSKPPSWFFNFRDILLFSNCGISSVRSSIRELISFGYLFQSQPHSIDGTFSYSNYTLFETPTKLSSTKTTTQPRDAFPHTVIPRTDKPHADSCTPVNNKIKITLGKITTTKPTKVVNTKPVVVSTEYKKKMKECIELCIRLYILNPHSLIKKYGLKEISKNAVAFRHYIPTASNPTGALISSIIEKWIPHKSQKGMPVPHVIEQKCSICLKFFSYLGFKPSRTICTKCEKKGK